MKAAIVTTPGNLEIQEIAEPLVGPYDARCELLYGATCTGTDQHLIKGEFPWPIAYPTILGHESIGRVTDVGTKVRNYRVGDLVTRVGTPPPPGSGLDVSWGGFTQVGIARDHRAMREDGVPEEEWKSYRVNQVLPPGTDPAAATMMITWRETWSFLTRMGVGAGHRVLIIGSGGNGLAFVSHAANKGVGQITLVGTAARESVARAAGATHTVDYKSVDALGDVSEVCPLGYDFIIDAVGKRGQLDAYLPALRPGGTLAMYGIDDFAAVTITLSRAPGSFVYFNGGYDEAEAHEDVVALMQSGKLRAELWLNLDTPYALDNINAAYEAVRDRTLVKALVRLTD